VTAASQKKNRLDIWASEKAATGINRAHKNASSVNRETGTQRAER